MFIEHRNFHWVYLKQIKKEFIKIQTTQTQKK